MDAGSTTASARHKNKPSKRQKPNEGQDIISKLPDFIIGWILSFLPTKDAVRTSVLSKRWEYLWTFITKLHFEIGVQHLPMRKTPKNFENFVNRVLFHLNNLSIQSFSLVIFGFLNHPNLVNDWISAVLNRRVQKLSLCLHPHEFIPLSFRSLLNCESLEELVLNMSWFGIIFHSSFYLPHLKILNLSGTEFECTSGSKELTFSFPVLETFETKDCFWSGTESVIFTVPLLKRVKIGYSMSTNCNLDDCAIKFRASHLTEFTYCGQMQHNIILLDSSAACTSSANLILNLTGSKEETGLRACMLLRQFSQVEFLKLYDEEVLEQAKEALADLPAFEMLRHLELGSVNVEIMLRVLLKSPFLKTLILEDICEFDEELLNSAIVSDCLKSTLKVIKFKGVRGYEHELCLVSFLMENAIVLERMHFAPAWCLRKSDSAMEEFKEKLISFKKGFTFVIIEFLWL